MKKYMAMLLALVMLITPCAALGETVVTSFYPIYLFALNLTQGLPDVEVHNLTAPTTGCLHDYQLQISDMKALNRANVFLINGAGMEGYLTDVTAMFPDLPVVDASRGVTLLEECEEEEAGDDHDDHDHDHDHGHEHEVNSHIWLDAQNAITMVNNLADGLIAALPEQHADAINANRVDYVARLEAVDNELKAGLADVAHANVVTFHEAFPYFANAYHLHVSAVVNHEAGDELTPKAMVALVHTIRDMGVPPLFVEPQYEDNVAQTLARETGAKIYTLDPVVTGPETDVPLTLYEDAMRRNLAVLQEALGE